MQSTAKHSFLYGCFSCFGILHMQDSMGAFNFPTQINFLYYFHTKYGKYFIKKHRLKSICFILIQNPIQNTLYLCFLPFQGTFPGALLSIPPIVCKYVVPINNSAPFSESQHTTKSLNIYTVKYRFIEDDILLYFDL